MAISAPSAPSRPPPLEFHRCFLRVFGPVRRPLFLYPVASTTPYHQGVQPRMSQQSLFEMTVEEAFADAIDQCRAKVVGPEVYPDEMPADAARHIRHDVDPTHRSKPGLRQLVLMLRAFRRHGCHQAMHALCAEAGYSAPEPLAIEDVETRVNDRLAELADEVGKLREELMRAREAAAPVRAVR